MSLSTVDKKKVMESFALGDNDTGSAAVQVAVLTEEIRLLTGHMKENKKDFSSKRGLIKMVSRRQRLLRYLKKADEKKYKDVIGRLGLKDRS